MTSAPLYPPHVKPAASPLPFPVNIATLLRNNLEVIPEQAYHEPLVIAPGPPRMAFVTGPELVKTMLLTRHAEFPKGALQNGVLEPVFGKAMLSCEGHEWRWQRAATAPLFHHDELLTYGPYITAAAEATVAAWRAAPGAIRAIDTDMMRAAFQVIADTMLAGSAKGMLQEIEMGHADYYRGMNWWVIYKLFGLPHWFPRPGGRLMRAHEARLARAAVALVQARRTTAGAGDDLLARLVRASDPETGRRMSDEHLANNIVAFLMAGYDATALALSWTLYLIARSPEWEAMMVEEVQRVAGSGPVTEAHVEHLVIVRQVLNESLRLFPTAPVIIRDVMTDVDIDGRAIPRGTMAIIPIYAIHRHRSYWNDPDRFDPTRFSPDAATAPSRYQFMPFGAGPRICIGDAFALIEATIMLATFVRAARFDVDPSFDPQPTGRMFLVAKNGMPMRVTMRDRAA